MDFDNYNYSVNETTSGIKAAAYKRTFKEYNPTNKDKKEDIIEAKPTLTHSINNTHYLAVVENKYKNEDDDSDDQSADDEENSDAGSEDTDGDGSRSDDDVDSDDDDPDNSGKCFLPTSCKFKLNRFKFSTIFANHQLVLFSIEVLIANVKFQMKTVV